MDLRRILEKNDRKESFMSKKMQYVIIGIMCFILTIGIVVQIKTVNNNGTTVGVKQEESELKTQVLKM